MKNLKRFCRLNLALGGAALVGAGLTALAPGITAPAGAVVASTPAQWEAANLDNSGCNAYIGDEASPVRAAIGEVDLYCNRAYSFEIYVELDHWSGSQWQRVGSYEVKLTTADPQVATFNNPGVCGYSSGTQYWSTQADVSFNGGLTWSGYFNDGVHAFDTGC
jgi:hypothetical protein